MMTWLTNPDIWASLLTLTALEVVLGIDNVIFISVVAGRLPDSQQARARAIGLGLALIMRIALLAGITWIIGLTAPLFEVFGLAVSWRDAILMAGGLFLLAKATFEIHHTVEGEEEGGPGAARAGFALVIGQI